jgi:hypothetical protein
MMNLTRAESKLCVMALAELFSWVNEDRVKVLQQLSGDGVKPRSADAMRISIDNLLRKWEHPAK